MADGDDGADDVEYWVPRRRPTWLIAVVGVIGLTIVLSVQYGPVRNSIETELTGASRQALLVAGVLGVEVVVSGRDATLSGGLADPQVRAQAVAAVADVPGVRVATVAGQDAAGGSTTAEPSEPVPGDSGATATATATATETATEVETATATEGQPATGTATVPEAVVAGLAELDTIAFAPQSASLSPAASRVIDDAAGLIAEAPTRSRFLIAAHTDSVGPAQANDALSQERADAVVAALVAEGIDPERLDAVGYGERRPAVTPENSDSDREANRRVEILPIP